MQLDTKIQKNDPFVLYPHYKELISGNKTEDNTLYKMAYPSSTYPILHIGFPIYDDDGNRLDPGHYEVALSADKKYLLLIQSKKLIAKVPTIKVTYDEEGYNESHDKYLALKEKYDYYQMHKRKKKYKEYEQEIEFQQKKLQAKNKAELDNSNPQYFLINYYCDFYSVIGYITRASQD